MVTLIHGGDVLTPHKVIPDGAVLVDGSRIVWVGSLSELPVDVIVDERIDARGRIITPGFIDLQLNGAAGRLLSSDPRPETVLAMSAVLPQFGCTAVLPTAITAPLERLVAAARAVTEAASAEPDGARILGLHLEGPFINPERSGAHHKPFIVPPSKDVLLRLWDASDGGIRVLTLAPELAGADDVIATARDRGIAVSIGHSNATPDQVAHAVNMGATLATHLFNAMSPLTSRAPGTVGGVLASDRLHASVIADGVHVHPISLKIAVRAKGAERLVLITDGMPPVGTFSDTFLLDGAEIRVQDGACYRPDGVLAGSVLTIDRAVNFMHAVVGIPLLQAVAMASSNPARAAGLADLKGSIEPGKDADIVIIDRDVHVWMTMVEGRIRYHVPERSGA